MFALEDWLIGADRTFYKLSLSAELGSDSGRWLWSLHRSHRDVHLLLLCRKHAVAVLLANMVIRIVLNMSRICCSQRVRPILACSYVLYNYNEAVYVAYQYASLFPILQYQASQKELLTLRGKKIKIVSTHCYFYIPDFLRLVWCSVPDLSITLT